MSSDIERPAIRQRRRRPRALFIVLASAIFLGVVEVGAALAFRVVSGHAFSYAEVAKLRSTVSGTSAGAATAEEAAQRAIRSGVVLHPYVGFVYDIENNARRGLLAIDGAVDRYGFMSDGSAVRTRSPDRFIVAITGGSVAYQLAALAGRVLADDLARSHRLAGRSIELVPLALGGFKQPQQVLALNYLFSLGAEFDCVINLDGFNEVALAGENLSVGVAPYFPRGWSSLARSAVSIDQQILVGRLAFAREARIEAARSGSGLGEWSVTAQLVWYLRDRARQAEISAAELALQQHRVRLDSFSIVGPGTEGLTPASSQAAMAALWARSSILMRDACAARGTHYFHFLQPNQYVASSKPMSAAERAAAFQEIHPYRDGVVGGYPMLAAESETLRRAGVRFGDLRQIFRDHPEPLYVDTCCHLNRAGYAIVAREIAEQIRMRLDHQDAAMAAIRVVPESLDLDGPGRSIPLRVVARSTDGIEFDVTDEAEFTSAETPLVEVSPYGVVQALGRAQAKIEIRVRGMEVAVPVRASWSPVMSSADGLGVHGKPAPRLEFSSGPPTATEPIVDLRCHGAPAGTAGILVLSTRAVKPALVTEPTDPETVVVPYPAAEGAAAPALRVELPASLVTRLRERAVHLRAFFPVGASGLVAASDGLVVTFE